jgi:hypothetical protein
MSHAPDTDPDLARPSWACVLCPPPRQAGAWHQADTNFVTCTGCDLVLRDRLDDVARRYLQLDSRPGATGDHRSRGAPGFSSRPPCNLHVISLRDPRSSADAKTWLGGDGRLHREDESPPLSVLGTLSCQAWSVAEHRGVDGPSDRADVFELLRWLGNQVSYATRHAELVLELDRAIRDLQAQLRPLTGDRRPIIGWCPAEIQAAIDQCRCGHEAGQHDNDAFTGERRCNVLYCGCRVFIPLRTEDAEPQVCGAPLRAPASGADSIDCFACQAHWAREDWLQLGDLIMSVA